MQNIATSALLTKQVRSAFQEYNIQPNQPLWIAYSGGLDSHTLLHILCHLSHPKYLTAIHINHQISPHANYWEQHCEQITRSLGVTFTSTRLSGLSAGQPDLEARARTARYAAYSAIVPANAILLMGHHLDDQAETILMRLCRGSGPTGLAGIPAQRQHQHFTLFRPLLTSSRAQIQHYAHEQKLAWIEDHSNASDHFSRNYLRHTVLPLLEKKWPAARENLCRSAQHCAEQNRLVHPMIDAIVTRITEQNSLHIPALLRETDDIQKAVIRQWQATWSPYPFTSKQLDNLFRSVIHARIDSEPALVHHQYIIRRYRENLYYLPKAVSTPPIEPITWPANQLSLTIPALKQVLKRQGTQENSLFNQVLTVRFRQGGERFHPVGRSASHPVKKLLQAWGVPPWERGYIPLIYAGDILVAIPGYASSAHPKAQGSITLENA